MAQKGKPASQKSAAQKIESDATVAEIQRDLKRQGFYAGEIDGNMGRSTKDALAARDAKAAAERDDARKAKELDIQMLGAQQAGKKTDTDAAAAGIALKRKQDYAADAGSAPGIATEIGAKVGAPLAGYAVGRKIGEGINYAADRSQEKRNLSLAAAAKGRLEGLTTREGSRTAAALAGAMPSSNSAVRVMSRMAPHAITGAGMAAKGALALSQTDPDAPYYADMANRAAGLGMIGTGVGIAEKGAAYGVAPGTPPNAGDLAIIESNTLRRPGTAAALAEPPVAPGPARPPTRADLIVEARKAGVPGAITSMKRDALIEALAGVKGGVSKAATAIKGIAPGLAAPGIAAALAYGMSPGEAQAADGSARGGGGAAATNAAVAGGAAYGLPRVAQALSGTMIGRGMARALPPVGAALTAYDIGKMAVDENAKPDQLLNGPQMGNSMPATPGNPGFMQRQQLAAQQAYGQPPSPQQAMPSAAGLDIPEGIPAPNADGSSPYEGGQPAPQQLAAMDPDISAQVQHLIMNGVSPQLIASYLNNSAR